MVVTVRIFMRDSLNCSMVARTDINERVGHMMMVIL